MSLFIQIDEDKLLRSLLPTLFDALRNWQRGMNSDEGALMNQLTSALNTSRARRCDIGVEEPLLVETQLYDLHRQGARTTDAFGSDLAVTVASNLSPSFTKTAFFQFKISKNNAIVVQRKQLDDAARRSDVFDRSFCFSVDPKSRTIRVESLAKLQANFVKDNESQTFKTGQWMGFSNWLVKWLSCSTGAWSTMNDPKGVEQLLQKYVLRSAETVNIWDLAPDYSPAKSWLKLEIEP